METTQPPPNGTPAETPPPRWRFFLALAVLVVTGLLVLAAAQFPPRTPSPGAGSPCPTCYAFSVVAGLGGTLTFNGTSPGPAMTVPLGSSVTVTLIVSPAASGPHSWMLVPRNGTPASPVVFPGANTTNPSVGTAPGSSATASFSVFAPGSYEYICGVASHYVEMWGYFNVTG